jgi:hypothetical protein
LSDVGNVAKKTQQGLGIATEDGKISGEIIAKSGATWRGQPNAIFLAYVGNNAESVSVIQVFEVTVTFTEKQDAKTTKSVKRVSFKVGGDGPDDSKKVTTSMPDDRRIYIDASGASPFYSYDSPGGAIRGEKREVPALMTPSSSIAGVPGPYDSPSISWICDRPNGAAEVVNDELRNLFPLLGERVKSNV